MLHYIADEGIPALFGMTLWGGYLGSGGLDDCHYSRTGVFSSLVSRILIILSTSQISL